MQISTLLTSSAAFAAVLASAAASTHRPNLAEDETSGTEGVLSRFDDEMLPISRMRLAGIGSTLAQDDGSYTTCLPVYGGATVADCTTVLGNIGSNTNDLGVVPGYCLNWWSGTCLAKICAPGDGKITNTTVPYYEKPSVVVDRLGGDPLNVCIKKGDAAVVSDEPDYASYKGLYRYYMQIRK